MTVDRSGAGQFPFSNQHACKDVRAPWRTVSKATVALYYSENAAVTVSKAAPVQGVEDCNRSGKASVLLRLTVLCTVSSAQLM